MATQTQLALAESGLQVASAPAYGFHGSDKYQQAAVIANGLPADGGTDLRLAEHVVGHAASAFRGTVGLPAGNGNLLMTAANWAGAGGLVFEIGWVSGWDTNVHAARAVSTLNRKEAETAILRGVEVQAIKRLTTVQLKTRGGTQYLGLGSWITVP